MFIRLKKTVLSSKKKLSKIRKISVKWGKQFCGIAILIGKSYMEKPIRTQENFNKFEPNSKL